MNFDTFNLQSILTFISILNISFFNPVLILFSIEHSSVANCHHVSKSTSNNQRPNQTDLSSLKLVQIVSRHGDRNPTKFFPTFPYQDEEKYWPEGLSQLTQLGRQQMFDLGVFLRKRYNGFISQQYNKFDTLVTSSVTERTIMSAEATMAGFYAPNFLNHSHADFKNEKESESSWNPYLNWQLVPVHAVSHNDTYLGMAEPCPKLFQIFTDFYTNSDYVKGIEINHRSLMNFFIEHMGLPPETSLLQLLTHQDTLKIAKLKNLEMPHWLNESMLDELTNLRYFVYTVETYLPEQKRLRGVLIKMLLDNMLEKIQSSNSNPRSHQNGQIHPRTKMQFYFAHDTTIGALLNILGIFNNIEPPHAATLILELHSLAKGDLQNLSPELDQYYVKISYYNDSKVEPYEMQVPGCSSPCPLKTLVSNLVPILPQNWPLECQVKGQLTSVSSEDAENEQHGCNTLSKSAGSSNFIKGSISSTLSFAFVALVVKINGFST